MNKPYGSVKIDKETHEILKKIKEKEGINIISAIKIAVKEKYEK